MVDRDPARFVPDLAQAREAGIRIEAGGFLGIGQHDLLADPSRWSRLAALRVVARVQSRAVREVHAALPVRAAERSVAVPEPRFGVEQRIVVPNGPGEHARCGNCAFRPGYVQCHACGGTGSSEVGMPTGQTIRETCRACTGTRLIVCSRCEGHARVWVGPALEIDDRYGELRHVYAPDVSLEIEQAIAAMIDEQASLPEGLSVSLEPRVADPYRGTLAGHAIAGHAYDTAIPMARTAIGGLSGEGEVQRAEIVLHAWPFLFARAHGDEVALIVDHAGVLRCLRARADP